MLTKNAIKVLDKRYLKRDETGPIETPHDLFMRVSLNIAEADAIYDRGVDVNLMASEYYELMTSLKFLPNSPTLMNAGRDLQQLSACFVLPVGDSMVEIFDAIKHTAVIHQTGGGTGFSFSKLRPKGDLVKRTMGQASGPVSFMKAFDAATETVKQGGTRRGANMAILRVDHPDILEFISCKKEEGVLANFNISVAVTDSFMNAVENNLTYPLINPRTGEETERLLARAVFNTIIQSAWENGEPGIIFIDRVNEYNQTPAAGNMEATNPCGEQPLLPYESCNLGSVNLGKFIKNGEIDWNDLKYVVDTAVRFLDNVIDMNNYPLPEIEGMTKQNRKIGLGVMGFADMLLQLNIPYNSIEAEKLAENIMSTIQATAIESSMKLAEKRGVFPAYPGSLWEQANKKIRNATTTTIAPTGSISIIAGASSGIEPLFAISYVRNVLDNAELPEVNPLFEQIARDKGFYSDSLMLEIAKKGSIADFSQIPDDIKKIFVTSHDISCEWHTRIQAAFQKHTDNAVSKTINLPNSASIKDVADAYWLSYRLGCKGVTVYRDGSRQIQVLSKGENKKTPDLAKPAERPKILRGDTYKYLTGCGPIYITVNKDMYNKPMEVFVRLGKSGGCLASQTETFGRLISTALRAGVDPLELQNQLIGVKCDRVAWSEGMKIESCADAIGKVLRDILGTEPPLETVSYPPISGGSLLTEELSEGGCPDCGAKLVYIEGCNKCSSNCGYSQC